MSFSHTADFTACPLGPFTTANKALAWGATPQYDGDPTGQYQSIVAGQGKTGGPCYQAFYPAGGHGLDLQMQLFRQTGGLPCTSEFDFKFKPGFDLARDVGKIGMQINWGALFGPNEGLSIFYIWNRAIAPNPATFTAIVQDQSGNQAPGLGQPPHYSAAIQLDRWYHFKHTLLGGPGGYAKFWIDGLLFASYTNVLNTKTNDTAQLNNFPHYGGGGLGPRVDSYALHDNCQYYSGDGPAQNPIVSGTITVNTSSGTATATFVDSMGAPTPATNTVAWTANTGAINVNTINGQQAMLTNNGTSEPVVLNAQAPNGVMAQLVIQSDDVPAAQEEVTGGNGSGDDWWGPQNPLEPIFPLNPSLGYIPPMPNPPSNPPPRSALWGFDNGLVAYVRNS